jgi:XRE family transcriptional regulator, regulator of sulfur utilization
MQKGGIKRGRPAGSKTYDEIPAKAFGAAVEAARLEDDIAQEELAYRAGIERSHMGKIERGEHAPTLVLIFRIARALGRSAGELMLEAEARLPDSWGT